MYDLYHPPMPIQITGPCADLEALLECEILRDARRYDLHGAVWIGIPEISEEQEALVLLHDCNVHCATIAAVAR